MSKIYLAGPVFTSAERHWNAQLAAAFRQRCTAEILLPQDFCKGIDPGPIMFRKCVEYVGKSDVVVVNVDGADADAGTGFEAGIAYAQGIELVMYRTDFRRAGDSELDTNVMLAYAGTFLTCHGDTPDTVASNVLRAIGY